MFMIKIYTEKLVKDGDEKLAIGKLFEIINLDSKHKNTIFKDLIMHLFDQYI